MSRRLFGAIACLFCFVAIAPVSALAQEQVNFLAIADWGSGRFEQRQVAGAMRFHVEDSNRKYSGVLCGGDNIYPPLTGIDDPLWDQLFESMYDRRVLKFPFYIAPGNHDYNDNKIPIELEYSRKHPESRWSFPSPYYRLNFPAGAEKPIVSVLMLDSDKDQMGPAAWDAELKWIEAELSKPRRAKWIIAVAHHPIFSNGEHGDNGVLRETWGKLFREHGVNLFICGHDHDLQHLEIDGWPTSFMLVGGGGQTIRNMRVDRRGPWSRSSYGFADLSFTPDLLTVRYVNEQNESIHSFTRTLDGQVKILSTTDSDPATPRTPKSINRPDLDEKKPSPTTQPN